MIADVEAPEEMQRLPLMPLSEATRASLEAVRRAQEAARERARKETARARIGAGMVVAVIVAGVIVLGPSLKHRLAAARAASAAPVSAGRTVARDTRLPPAGTPRNDSRMAAAATDSVAAAVPPSAAAIAPTTAASTARPATASVRAPASAPAAGATASDASSSACAETFEQHRWQISIEECTRLFEAHPTDGDLALRIAHANHARARLPEAATWANRALALNPSLAEAYVIVAHAETQAGNTAAAVEAYRQYLNLAPRGWHAGEARAAVRGHAKPGHARAPLHRGPASVQVAARE